MIEANFADGACKRLGNRNAYAFLIPVPLNPAVRAQVFVNGNDGATFGDQSLCEIEHLFFGDELTAPYFENQRAPGGGNKIVLKSDAMKERFARDVVPRLDDRFFEVFRPMFERICAIIG